MTSDSSSPTHPGLEQALAWLDEIDTGPFSPLRPFATDRLPIWLRKDLRRYTAEKQANVVVRELPPADHLGWLDGIATGQGAALDEVPTMTWDDTLVGRGAETKPADTPPPPPWLPPEQVEDGSTHPQPQPPASRQAAPEATWVAAKRATPDRERAAVSLAREEVLPDLPPDSGAVQVDAPLVPQPAALPFDTIPEFIPEDIDEAIAWLEALTRQQAEAFGEYAVSAELLPAAEAPLPSSPAAEPDDQTLEEPVAHLSADLIPQGPLPYDPGWLNRTFGEASDSQHFADMLSESSLGGPDDVPLALVASTDSFFWPAEEEESPPDIEVTDTLSDIADTQPSLLLKPDHLPVTALRADKTGADDSAPTLYAVQHTSALPELLEQTFADMEQLAVPVGSDRLSVPTAETGQELPDSASLAPLPDEPWLVSADLEAVMADPEAVAEPFVPLPDEVVRPDGADLIPPDGQEAVAESELADSAIFSETLDSTLADLEAAAEPFVPLPDEAVSLDGADLTPPDGQEAVAESELADFAIFSETLDSTLADLEAVAEPFVPLPDEVVCPDGADLTPPDGQEAVAESELADSAIFSEALDSTLDDLEAAAEPFVPLPDEAAYPDGADLTLPDGQEAVAESELVDSFIFSQMLDSTLADLEAVAEPFVPLPDEVVSLDGADLTLPDGQEAVAESELVDSAIFSETLDSTLRERVSADSTFPDQPPDIADSGFFHDSTLSDPRIEAVPSSDQSLPDLPLVAEERLPDLDLDLVLTEEAARSEPPTPTEPARHQLPAVDPPSDPHLTADDQPAESGEAALPPPAASPSSPHVIPDDLPIESEEDALIWLDTWVDSLDDTPRFNSFPEPVTEVMPRPDDEVTLPAVPVSDPHPKATTPEPAHALPAPESADAGDSTPQPHIPQEDGEAGDDDHDYSLSGDNLEDALAWLESRDPAGSTFYEWQEPETPLADSRPGTIITGLYAKERRYAFAAFNGGDYDTFIAVCRKLLQSSPTAAVIVESDLRALAERMPPLPAFSCLLGDACAAQGAWEQAAEQYRLAVEQARNDMTWFEAFLPLLDHLEEVHEAALAPLQEMMPTLLEKLGVSRIPTVGYPNDPELHVVVGQRAVPGSKAGMIVAQRRSGYVRHGQIVRRAEVEISH